MDAFARPGHQLDDYRYPGEKEALILGLVFLVVVGFGVMAVSLGFAVLALAGGLFYVRTRQGQLLGNSALVTPTNFARVHRIVSEGCRRLQVNHPRVHILQDPYLNAFALGFGPPFSVVLHSALVNSLTDDELLFVISHELGHIKAGHTVWLSFIAPLGRTIPGFDLIFGVWQRRAEYTADRIGFLGCSDLGAAMRAIIKVSAGPDALEHTSVREFLKQAQELRASDIDRIGEWFGTHPYTVNRIQQLISFAQVAATRVDDGHSAGDPEPEIQRRWTGEDTGPAQAVDNPTKEPMDWCPHCGTHRLTSGGIPHRFCTWCGYRFPDADV